MEGLVVVRAEGAFSAGWMMENVCETSLIGKHVMICCPRSSDRLKVLF